MESKLTFGEFLRDRRVKNTGLSLREFCATHDIDPGNFSRLERGVMEPPHGADTLERYALALKIERESDDWFLLFDLAAASRGKIPVDLMKDEELVKKLPAVFRTLRQKRVDGDELDELIEMVRKS